MTKLETILLEKYHMAASQAIDLYDMKKNNLTNAEIFCRIDHILETLVFMIDDFVWEETGLIPTEVTYIRNWWEGLKECVYRWQWFPKYIKNKYPVQFTTVIVEFHAIYPNFKPKLPNKKCIIHKVERYE